ncbi:universal stress protein [Amaricoccus macauensis]|uniref:universal stress protein n=1 Tax=Amaricoccus macauensis TaxID=57001 RepID=UPI003C7BFFB1
MTCILVGLDGSAASERALAHAKRLAKLIGDCELSLAFIIDWTPYSFHTQEELAERHKRREAELEQARSHVLDPAAKALEADGFKVTTHVQHGDPVELIEKIAKSTKAEQIIIGRTGDRGLKERLFGSVSGKLVASATVPVTIIP